jgi:PKD repeat protein
MTQTPATRPRPRRRALRWAIPAVVVGTVGAVVGTALAVEPDPPLGNLTQNASFEIGPANLPPQGWEVFRAAIAKTALSGAPNGANVVKVTAKCPPAPCDLTTKGYAINDFYTAVPVTTAGTTYSASAWVKGDATTADETVELIVDETRPPPDGSLVGRSPAATTLSTSEWKKLSVTRTVAESGNRLDVYVRVKPSSSIAENDFFYADLILFDQHPNADFNVPANIVTGQPVAFTDLSTDAGGGIIAGQAWDLDNDGAFDDAFGPTAVTTFPAAGNYVVKLKVTDAGGHESVASKTVSVASAGQPSPQPPGTTPTPTPTPVPPANAGDTTKPSLTAFKLKLKGKTRLVMFKLSERATVSVQLQRKKGKKFVKVKSLAAKRLAKGQRQLSLGTLSAGSYRLRITLKDVAGNTTIVIKTATVK